jgi:hypothetical protein
MFLFSFLLLTFVILPYTSSLQKYFGIKFQVVFGELNGQIKAETQSRQQEATRSMEGAA